MNDVSPLIYDMVKGSIRDALKVTLDHITWGTAVSRMRYLGLVTLGDAMRFNVGQTPFHIHGVISLRTRLHLHV